MHAADGLNGGGRTPTQVDSATLNVTWTGAIVADTCTVSATFQGSVTNARDAVLESVTYGGRSRADRHVGR